MKATTGKSGRVAKGAAAKTVSLGEDVAGGGDEKSGGKNSGTLEFLMRRMQHKSDFPRPKEGPFQMQLVYQLHQLEIGLLHGRPLAVRRRARQAQ